MGKGGSKKAIPVRPGGSGLSGPHHSQIPRRIKSGIRLQKVPLVAVEVFEDDDHAIGFVTRGLEKFDIVGLHLTVVAPEIIGVEKQENTSASLIADGVRLLGCSGLNEKETGAVGVWRRDNQPALVIGKGRVFNEAKAEGLREEGESLIVAVHEERDVSEVLRHGR